MNSRKFSLRTLVGKIFSKRRESTVHPTAVPKRTSARERVRSGIEPLEGRVAPAVLLNGHTLAYNDLDGDLVKVTFSKDIFDLSSGSLPTTLAAVFKFSAGKAHTGAVNGTDDVNQQLQLIDLSSVPPKLTGGVLQSRVAGVSLSVTAETNPASGLPLGDGFAAIGAIKAGSNALGNVLIDGDLGKITAGTGTAKIGLGILSVQSIGKFGTSTQSASPAPDLNSVISGRLVRLIVQEDVKGYLHVVDSTLNVTGVTQTTQRGTIDQINILGSLDGDTGDNTGRIDSSYLIGNAFIGTDSSEGIFGGVGKNSGSITAAQRIVSVTVSGNVDGSTGESSGVVSSGGIVGNVKIGGELRGASGLNSGSVRSGGAMSDVTIGSNSAHHDVIGGSGTSSGAIVSGGAMGNVHVFGGITGSGLDAGMIVASGNLKSVIVDENLTGGGSASSGSIESKGNLGPVFVLGSVQGGNGAGSGTIVAAGTFTRVTVLGDVTGGQGDGSGALLGGHDPSAAVRNLGNVFIGGQLAGGNGIGSGGILSGGTLGVVRIGSSLQSGYAIEGGVGALSGTVFAQGAISSVTTARGVQGSAGPGSGSIQAQGALGSLTILGDVVGGTGAESGSVFSHEDASAARPVAGYIGPVTITGTLAGGGDHTALIQSDGILVSASIGAMQGGSGAFSGSVVSGAGYVKSGATTFISVAGTIEGGTGNHSGAIQLSGRLGNLTTGSLVNSLVQVGDDLGVLRVNGDVTGSIISARGQAVHAATSDVAIGSALISGSVTNSRILGGYDTTGAAVNADAQIGAVRVIGDWSRSVIAAGVIAGPDGNFGTIDDAIIPLANSPRIISQIASVIVGGNIVDGVSAGHFGFVAQRIGSFSAHGVPVALSAAPGEVFEVSGNTSVREVVAVV